MTTATSNLDMGKRIINVSKSVEVRAKAGSGNLENLRLMNSKPMEGFFCEERTLLISLAKKRKSGGRVKKKGLSDVGRGLCGVV